MTNVMANLFANVHLSKAKLTVFLDGNCFVIESIITESSLQQMLVQVSADCSTSSLRNTIYDYCS